MLSSMKSKNEYCFYCKYLLSNHKKLLTSLFFSKSSLKCSFKVSKCRISNGSVTGKSCSNFPLDLPDSGFASIIDKKIFYVLLQFKFVPSKNIIIIILNLFLFASLEITLIEPLLH